LVAFYKTIRETTQHGKLYRLLSPRESEVAANQFVSEDGGQSVVFALLRTREFYSIDNPRVTLRGLEPSAQYRVKPLHATKLMESVESASGAWLMQHGLHFAFPAHDMDGTAVVLERIP
jgi:alpha-galactosidase